MSGTTTGSPLWSPNGQQLVFDSDTGGAFHLYEIGADGGRPRQAESGESYFGSWSHAGRWIYFSSNRSGREQAWKLPAGGGALRR